MTLTSSNIEDTAVQSAVGQSLHRRGLTGLGIGIAVIDSGVSAPGEFGTRLVIGPDLTADAGTDSHGVDRTGHGTHLAGIAAGAHVGVAPGSHVITLKVAHAGGTTDVRAVIEAIEFTIAHRHQLSIGVLLLAFGADQLPAGEHDPLAAAVARAWRAGIVVVTSSGNGGQDAPLSTPTHIDEVLTVAGVECTDGHWTLCDFSDRGVDGCRPDIAAPAKSIVGPVAPGSEAAEAPESSFVSEGFVKGSGTSQAAAVVAGAVALLLEADPSLTPDEVKQVLSVSAIRTGEPGAGAGALDLDVALAYLGSGLFRDADARWSADLVPAGLEWATNRWSTNRWSTNRWSTNRWSTNRWSTNRWSTNRWSTNRWSTNRWSTNRWSTNRWSTNRWSTNRWSTNRWSGLEWATNRWSTNRWSGLEWATNRWSTNRWSGLEWATNRWSTNRWSGLEWATNRWSTNRWSGLEWATNRWSTNRWSGLEWATNRWSTNRWSGLEWATNRWSTNRWSGLEWATNRWS